MFTSDEIFSVPLLFTIFTTLFIIILSAYWIFLLIEYIDENTTCILTFEPSTYLTIAVGLITAALVAVESFALTISPEPSQIKTIFPHEQITATFHILSPTSASNYLRHYNSNQYRNLQVKLIDNNAEYTIPYDSIHVLSSDGKKLSVDDLDKLINTNQVDTLKINKIIRLKYDNAKFIHSPSQFIYSVLFSPNSITAIEIHVNQSLSELHMLANNTTTAIENAISD